MGFTSRAGDLLFCRRAPALKRAPLLPCRGRRTVRASGRFTLSVTTMGVSPKRFGSRGSRAGLHVRCGQGGSGGGLSGKPLAASSHGLDRDLSLFACAFIRLLYFAITCDTSASSFGGVGVRKYRSLELFRSIVPLELFRLAGHERPQAICSFSSGTSTSSSLGESGLFRSGSCSPGGCGGSCCCSGMEGMDTRTPESFLRGPTCCDIS